jgi:hypothetical protein
LAPAAALALSAPPLRLAAVDGKHGLSAVGLGAALQCGEALTLGMPLEVWKTRMGRYRDETTLQVRARRGW